MLMHGRSLFPQKSNAYSSQNKSLIKDSIDSLIIKTKSNTKKLIEVLNQPFIFLKKENIILILKEVNIEVDLFIFLYKKAKEKNILIEENISIKRNEYNSILLYILQEKLVYDFSILSQIKRLTDFYLSSDEYTETNRIKRFKNCIKKEGGSKFILIAFEIFLRVCRDDFNNFEKVYNLLMNLPKNTQRFSIREIFKVFYKYLEDFEFKLSLIYEKEMNDSKFKNVYKILNKEKKDKNVDLKKLKNIEVKPSYPLELSEKTCSNDFTDILKETDFFLKFLFDLKEKDKHLNYICFKNSEDFYCKICDKLALPLNLKEYRLNLRELNSKEIHNLLKHEEINLSEKENIMEVIKSYFKENTNLLNFGVYLKGSLKNMKAFLLEKFKEIKSNFKLPDYEKFICLVNKEGDLEIEMMVFKYTFINFDKIFKKEAEIERISEYFVNFEKKKEIVGACVSFFIKKYKEENKENNKEEEIELEKINERTFSLSTKNKKTENQNNLKLKKLEIFLNPLLKLFKYNSIKELIADYEEIIIYKLLKEKFILSSEFDKYINNGISEILYQSPGEFNSLDLIYKHILKKNAFDIFTIFIQKEDFDENMLDFIIENYSKEAEMYVIPLIFHLKNNFTNNSNRKCVYKAFLYLINYENLTNYKKEDEGETNRNFSYISSSIIYFLELTDYKCNLHKGTCIKEVLRFLIKTKDSNLIKEIFPYLKYKEINNLKYKEINKLPYSTERSIDLLKGCQYRKGRENSLKQIFYLKYNEFIKNNKNNKNNENILINLLESLKSISIKEIKGRDPFSIFFSRKTNKEMKIKVNNLSYEKSLEILSQKLLNSGNLNTSDKIFFCLQEFSEKVESLSIFRDMEFSIENENLTYKENIYYEKFKEELMEENEDQKYVKKFYEDIFLFVKSKLEFHSKRRYEKLFLGNLFDLKVRNEFLFQMVFFLKDYDLSELKEFVRKFVDLKCDECILSYKNYNYENKYKDRILFNFFHRHDEIHNFPIDLFYFLFKLNQYANSEIVSYYDLLILSIQFKLWKYSYQILYILYKENKDEIFFSYLLIVLYFLDELEDINNLHEYIKKPNLYLFLKSENKKIYLKKEERKYLKKFCEYDSFGKILIKEIYEKVRKIKKVKNYKNKKEIYKELHSFSLIIENVLNSLFIKNFQYKGNIEMFVYNISLIFFIRKSEVFDFIKANIAKNEKVLKSEKVVKWYLKFFSLFKLKDRKIYKNFKEEVQKIINFLQFELFEILIEAKKHREANKIIDKLIAKGNYDAFYLKSLLFKNKEEKLKILNLCEFYKPEKYFSNFIIERAKLNNTLSFYNKALQYSELIDVSEIHYLLAKYYEKKGNFIEVFLNYEKCVKLNKKYLKEVFPQMLFLFTTKLFEEDIKISFEYLSSADLIIFYNQIISKISHKSDLIGKEIINLCIKLINDFPEQTMWNSIQYIKNTNKQVSKRMNMILSKITNKNIFDEILELSKIFKKIAKYPLKSVNEFSLKKKFPDIEKYKIKILMGNKIVRIENWVDEVKIYNSLKRPKRVSFYDENGQIHNLLCKYKEDLRKDQRCMEFFNLFNLLSEDLKIKTYCVIPFDSESGILEMVDDIFTIKSLIKFNAEETELIGKFRKACNKTNSFEEHLPKMIEKLKPRLRQFFLENFTDPDSFYEGLNNFVRSYAVMCGVGWFIGLGDRHCDNIAIHRITGETVHVDINLIFEAGKKLAIPEKVPFRLTNNLRDAFIFDINGLFRKYLEKTLNLLKENKELVLNNMLAFVFDPLFRNNESIFENLKNKLEIEDLTDSLIESSICLKNLGDMFVGWASYI